MMTDSREFHFARRGAGPRLLLIQGTAAGLQHWGSRFLAALTSRCEVVAYDHRGIGGSASADNAFAMAELVDDAVSVLDQVGWEHANVFGVSLGGVVAQELALRHPDRVERMILGGTNAGGCGGGKPGNVVDYGLSAAVVHGDRAVTSQNLFRLGVKDPETVAVEAWSEYRAAELTSAADPHAVVLQMTAYSQHSTASRLPDLRVPTLIVHGEADRIIDLADGVTLARAIPGAQLRVLSAGHLFWLESPDLTAVLVADFCEKVVG